MARRYSDIEQAAIWALRCQGKGPIEIRRILAADGAGLGYEMHGNNGDDLLPRRSIQEILKRLEAKLGAPVPIIEPGHETDAIDAIRREGLGAIRLRVKQLRDKQGFGALLSAPEVRTLDAAVRAADGARARALFKSNLPESKAGREGGAARTVSESVLLESMARELGTDGALIEGTEPTNGTEPEPEPEPEPDAQILASVEA